MNVNLVLFWNLELAWSQSFEHTHHMDLLIANTEYMCVCSAAGKERENIQDMSCCSPESQLRGSGLWPMARSVTELRWADRELELSLSSDHSQQQGQPEILWFLIQNQRFLSTPLFCQQLLSPSHFSQGPEMNAAPCKEGKEGTFPPQVPGIHIFCLLRDHTKGQPLSAAKFSLPATVCRGEREGQWCQIKELSFQTGSFRSFTHHCTPCNA